MRNKNCIYRNTCDVVAHPTCHLRRAFTLVELLAVTVIIGILAGLTALAINASIQAAKESKTRGTITKLDSAMQIIFEAYEEKFESLNDVYDASNNPVKITNAFVPAENAALAKLHFIRDTMMFEMPVTWEEVLNTTNPPSSPPVNTDVPVRAPVRLGTYRIDPPGVSGLYRRAYINGYNTGGIDPDLASAELLYLIVMNLNPEALASFDESEIGDSDGNGLMEFHDAWENPIHFLRWAPAFAGTDKQPDVKTRYDNLGGAGNMATEWQGGPNDAGNSPTDTELQGAMAAAATAHHDPFDPESQTISWFLYPVIFSAGPDKVFDVNENKKSDGTVLTLPTTPLQWSGTNRPILDAFAAPLGAPITGEGYFDNIHNHRISGGF